jgi:hypothetical protein
LKDVFVEQIDNLSRSVLKKITNHLNLEIGGNFHIFAFVQAVMVAVGNWVG